MLALVSKETSILFKKRLVMNGGKWICSGGCQDLTTQDINAIETKQSNSTTTRFECYKCKSPVTLEITKDGDLRVVLEVV